jgi:biotin transport system substrate-specific component
VIYCTGTPYLAAYMHVVLNKPDAVGLAIKTGALVFLPGDILKCLILALIVPRLGLRKDSQGSLQI